MPNMPRSLALDRTNPITTTTTPRTIVLTIIVVKNATIEHLVTAKDRNCPVLAVTDYINFGKINFKIRITIIIVIMVPFLSYYSTRKVVENC